jgi:hypothetical protein
MSRAFATVLVAALAVAVGSAAGATPRWQPVPGVGADDREVVWAAGRAWFMNNNTTGSDRFTTKSARIAGGRLSGWVTASRAGMSGWTNLGLEGDGLVFATSTPRPGSPPPFRSIRLLPNGKLGAPEELHGAAPSAFSTAVAVVRLPDRLVYEVDACRYRPGGSCGNERVVHLGLCCDVNGEAVDYASIAPPATAPLAVTGLDRQGRIWLAWTQARGNRPPQAVQIDPATLQPRGRPSAAPGSLLAAKIVDLACSDTCRLVLTGAARGTRDTSFTWAPGERSLTPIRPPGTRALVIAARPGPGRLDLAFNFTRGSAAGDRALGVGRGDARGARLRLASSIAIPQTLGPFERGIQLTLEPMGSFGPGGFVASAVWENFGTGRATVQAAVLPLR